jgi:hypothetical protein
MKNQESVLNKIRLFSLSRRKEKRRVKENEP